jgi:hypothetical protein
MAAPTVFDTLATRQNTHGDYKQNTVLMQELKLACSSSPNWKVLPAYQKETIDMICHKLGRILHGNPFTPDHWHDIAGYATLTEQIVRKDITPKEPTLPPYQVV